MPTEGPTAWWAAVAISCPWAHRGSTGDGCRPQRGGFGAPGLGYTLAVLHCTQGSSMGAAPQACRGLFSRVLGCPLLPPFPSWHPSPIHSCSVPPLLRTGQGRSVGRQPSQLAPPGQEPARGHLKASLLRFFSNTFRELPWVPPAAGGHGAGPSGHGRRTLPAHGPGCYRDHWPLEQGASRREGGDINSCSRAAHPNLEGHLTMM